MRNANIWFYLYRQIVRNSSKQEDKTSQINTSYMRHEPLLARVYKYSHVEESCGVIRCDFFRRKVNVRRKLQATLSDISPQLAPRAACFG